VTKSTKIRLAIGLFSGVNELAAVIEALLQTGIGQDRLRVVVTVAREGGAVAGPLAGGSEASPPGVGAWRVLVPAAPRARAGDGTRLRSSPTRARRGDAEGNRGPTEPDFVLAFRRWSLDRQVRRLQTHLENGGAAVFIRVLDDAEQMSVCATLLDHASTSVETHEVGRGRSGAVH